MCNATKQNGGNLQMSLLKQLRSKSTETEKVPYYDYKSMIDYEYESKLSQKYDEIAELCGELYEDESVNLKLLFKIKDAIEEYEVIENWWACEFT